MSESETKQITGVCTEIAQKPGNDWVEFHIDGGGQYPVRLSTKLQPLIELGKAAGQALAVWTYEESQGNPNPNRPGSFYMNRYLSKVEVGGTETAPAATPPQGVTQSTLHHAPLVPGDKDRAITRMACLRTAAMVVSAPTLTTPVEDAGLEVMGLAARFETWVYRDIDDPPF